VERQLVTPRGRTNRRLDQPRETTLAAALELIAEQGLGGMTMAALGKRLGTSGGHLLYYFGSKDQLLLETLRWSEEGYDEQRDELLRRPPDVDTVVAFADLFMPAHPEDSRWVLWLDLWARAPYNPTLAAAQRELDAAWRRTLVAIADAGVAAGTFRREPVAAWLDQFLAMLDGFSILVVTGAPTSKATLLDRVRADVETTLLPGAHRVDG
jgi:AcrR family transcriptional regulator